MDEQWIAIGVSEDGVRQQRVRQHQSQVGEQLPDVAGTEATQHHSSEVPHPPQLGQRARQPVRTVDFGVAIGANHQQSALGSASGQVQEQIERAQVGCVQIFQNHNGALRPCCTTQEFGQRIEHAVTLFLRIATRFCQLDIEALRQQRHDPRDIACAGPQLGP